MTIIEKFRNNTINSQIVLAFFTLTALIISLEVLAYIWTKQMHSINSLKESSTRLKEMQMLLKSSSNEFILREKANEHFFASGKSIYLDRYNYNLGQLRKNIDEIDAKSIAINGMSGMELIKLRATVENYNEVFRQMVTKIKLRGYGRYGLIGEFDKSIENLLQYNFGTNKIALLNLQLFVKDYLLSGDKDLVSNISDEIYNFTMVLEKHIKDDQVERVSSILINYETVFKELTNVDSDLGIYTGEGLQNGMFLAIDNLDRAVQLEKINRCISQAQTDILQKIYLSFFLIISVAVATAFILNRRLHKTLVVPIQQMKSILAKMGRGDVSEFNVVSKVYDLNEMAMALNNLIQGIKNYRAFANDIGRGNLDAAFTPLSDHDILGNSLLSMRASLKASADADKKREWAAHGLAEMNTLLRIWANNVSEQHQNILQFIVRYLNSNQGSLFLVRNESETIERHLELVACYAWEKRKYIDKRLKLDEGLVGQCVLEKDLISLTNIPRDYIKITSGLGDSNPTALLIVPLKFEDKVVGVLEIASFKNFEKHQIDFIKKFSESLALAINIEDIKLANKIVIADGISQN